MKSSECSCLLVAGLLLMLTGCWPARSESGHGVVKARTPLPATRAAKPSAGGVRFGLNCFLGNLQHSEIRGPLVRPTALDRTHYLDAVRDLGMTSIRETFMNWAEIEPQRGEGYELEAFDDIARKASERGIEIVGLAYPFPCWATGAAPTPKDQLFSSMWQLPRREFEQDFRVFVRSMVKRYCGQYSESLSLNIPIRQWIFSNELDAFKASPDECAFWQKVFCEEVKRTDPGAKVITIGLCVLPGTAFLDAFLDSPELKGPGYPYFDAVTYHCYIGLNAKDIYMMNAAAGNIRRSLHARSIDAELWLDETGDRSPDRARQAAQDVKLLLHAASNGVSRVNLHGLWSFGETDLWGVLEDAQSGQVPTRKPSFTAFQTLQKMIGENRGVQFLCPGRYLAMLPDGRAVYGLWAEAPNLELFDLLRGRVKVTTLRNEEKTIDAAELKLSDEPVFVEVLK
ncbi:MAG: hypothetical protein ABIP55_08000 [Tepidisphaeraceae bacterium]